jgi:hypothetical protein
MTKTSLPPASFDRDHLTQSSWLSSKNPRKQFTRTAQPQAGDGTIVSIVLDFV